MGVSFTLQEGAALYGLLAETTTDIVIRTDDEGFILHASPAIGRLGVPASGMLIAPHLFDLVHPDWVAAIKPEYAAAMKGKRSSGWCEFMAQAPGGSEQWYAMKIRCLNGERGSACGAMVILRSIDDRKALEADVFAASFTDSLTGLTNRKAFSFMLSHLVGQGARGCLALFDIDHFKRLNLQFGLAAGDELLVAFARFLRNNLRPEDILSRVECDRFAVLLPEIAPEEARALAGQVLGTFARLGKAPAKPRVLLTASCGLASIVGSFDATMARAGEALHLAKAIGGNCAEANRVWGTG